MIKKFNQWVNEKQLNYNEIINPPDDLSYIKSKITKQNYLNILKDVYNFLKEEGDFNSIHYIKDAVSTLERDIERGSVDISFLDRQIKNFIQDVGINPEPFIKKYENI